MDSDPAFLEVSRLLDSSQPRPRPAWVWYALLGVLVVMLLGNWAGAQNPDMAGGLRLLGAVAMSGVFVAVIVVSQRAARQQRLEQQRLEAIEEMVQLRRWDQAAASLDALLGAPTRHQAIRLQALIYLANVLARYHRFDDAVGVHDYLLEHAEFDPGTSHGLKLMRAMALLHCDRLFDADRAISDLRRESTESAGLALIEIYRDVKTGHPAEAIEVFNRQLPRLRDQLGHRVADAWALAARAYDLMDRPADAADAFEKATLLCPVVELSRRYSEFAAIQGKYPVAPMPQAGEQGSDGSQSSARGECKDDQR